MYAAGVAFVFYGLKKLKFISLGVSDDVPLLEGSGINQDVNNVQLKANATSYFDWIASFFE